MISTRTPHLISRLTPVALLGLLACFGCDKPAPPPPPPAEVVALTLAPQEVPDRVQFVSQVESSHQVEILARVSGFLDKITYKEGDLVSAGQVMFRIDPKPFEAAVAAAKGEVASREAELWTAQANLNRVKPLAALDAASKSDLDNATGAVQAAEAALYSARANLDKTQLDLSYTIIHAPVSGVSGEAFFREGTYLNANAGARLSYVAKLDPIWVTFSLSQNQMTQRQQEIAAGQLVPPPNRDYSIEVELSDGSLYPFEGKLNFISPTFNQETGTFLIRAELPNPQGVLRPGMFVKATVKGAVRPNSIVVPQKAVQQTDNGHVVFVASPQGTAEVRPVIVGDWIGSDWLIKQGLKAGEQVITDGFQRLKPGAPIKVTTSQKQGAAASQAAAVTPAAPAATPAPAPAAKAEPAKPSQPKEAAPAAEKPAAAPAAPAKPAAAPPDPAVPAKPADKAPAKTSSAKPVEQPVSKSVLVSKTAPASRPAAAPGGAVIPSGQLLLGMLANHDQAKAEQYAANLEKALGQPVAIRLFEDETTLVKWFRQYRMLDLAIIPSKDRSDLLAGDYQLLQSARLEKLVARRDLPADVLNKLTQGLANSRQPDSSQILPAQIAPSIVVAAN